VESTLAQLGELAVRIEESLPAVDPRDERPAAKVEPKVETAKVEPGGGREPVAPNIPPSAEVIRLLREHLT
jgi:hypothetical protein